MPLFVENLREHEHLYPDDATRLLLLQMRLTTTLRLLVGRHESRDLYGRCAGILSPQVPGLRPLPSFDNGSEFMHGHFTRFCGARDITFTRSRPYQGNDNPHMEEKGGSVIRTFVGSDRHDSQAETLS